MNKLSAFCILVLGPLVLCGCRFALKEGSVQVGELSSEFNIKE